MKKIKKIIQVLQRNLIKCFVYISVDIYMKKYVNFLKKIGIDFIGTYNKPKFIDKSVYFDGTDYSLIHLGDNVTISREVMFLTHDYSINTAYCSLGKKIGRHEGELYFKKDIYIGNDCFIGARVSILPGTKIGNNCIIGACSVVKGIIPNNSIVVGNPSVIIGETTNYAKKHIEKKDYFIE